MTKAYVEENKSKKRSILTIDNHRIILSNPNAEAGKIEYDIEIQEKDADTWKRMAKNTVTGGGVLCIPGAVNKLIGIDTDKDGVMVNYTGTNEEYMSFRPVSCVGGEKKDSFTFVKVHRFIDDSVFESGQETVDETYYESIFEVIDNKKNKVSSFGIECLYDEDLKAVAMWAENFLKFARKKEPVL